jgi:hypothetical protein
MNFINFIFQLAVNPAIFSIRYPAGYLASKIRYPVYGRISKTGGYPVHLGTGTGKLFDSPHGERAKHGKL